MNMMLLLDLVLRLVYEDELGALVRCHVKIVLNIKILIHGSNQDQQSIVGYSTRVKEKSSYIFSVRINPFHDLDRFFRTS
jgi:hypothetical protein